MPLQHQMLAKNSVDYPRPQMANTSNSDYEQSMSNQGKLSIPRSTDGTVLDVLSDLASKYNASYFSIHVFGMATSIDPRIANWLPIAQQIRNQNSTIIRTASLGFADFSITFQRGGDSGTEMIDQLTFGSNGQQPSTDVGRRLEILDILTKKLNAVSSEELRNGHFDTGTQITAFHNSMLQRLEQAATDQILRNGEHLQKVETSFSEKRVELEKEFVNKSNELDLWERDRRSEYEAKESLLREREAHLDDRQNTHARRALQERIKEGIAARQKQFVLTQGTKKLRWPIHALCIFLLCVFGGLLYWSSSQTLDLLRNFQAMPPNGSGSNLELVYLLGRSVTLAAAFAGVAFFYLRWMNRWFEQHAEAEFVVKKLELDVDRASWVVETALEWNNQVKQPMPDGLLVSISRNLFEGATKGEDFGSNPTDQLASAILGTAATKLKINVGNAELEVDPSKLAKSAISH